MCSSNSFRGLGKISALVLDMPGQRGQAHESLDPSSFHMKLKAKEALLRITMHNKPSFTSYEYQYQHAYHDAARDLCHL